MSSDVQQFLPVNIARMDSPPVRVPNIPISVNNSAGSTIPTLLRFSPPTQARDNNTSQIEPMQTDNYSATSSSPTNIQLLRPISTSSMAVPVRETLFSENVQSDLSYTQSGPQITDEMMEDENEDISGMVDNLIENVTRDERETAIFDLNSDDLEREPERDPFDSDEEDNSRSNEEALHHITNSLKTSKLFPISNLSGNSTGLGIPFNTDIMDEMSKTFEDNKEAYAVLSQIAVKDATGNTITTESLLKFEDEEEDMKTISTPGAISLGLESVQKAVDDMCEKKKVQNPKVVSTNQSQKRKVWNTQCRGKKTTSFTKQKPKPVQQKQKTNTSLLGPKKSETTLKMPSTDKVKNEVNVEEPKKPKKPLMVSADTFRKIRDLLSLELQDEVIDEWAQQVMSKNPLPAIEYPKNSSPDKGKVQIGSEGKNPDASGNDQDDGTENEGWNNDNDDVQITKLEEFKPTSSTLSFPVNKIPEGKLLTTIQSKTEKKAEQTTGEKQPSLELKTIAQPKTSTKNATASRAG